jgi:hypothetical protein
MLMVLIHFSPTFSRQRPWECFPHYRSPLEYDVTSHQQRISILFRKQTSEKSLMLYVAR